MITYTQEPQMEAHRFTEYDFQEKFQDEAKSAEFRNLRRKWRNQGTTYDNLVMTTNDNPTYHATVTTSEAVTRTADLVDANWVPDVFFQQILEGTQYLQIGRTIANVYNAPPGQPQLIYREFDRFLRAQIVGEDDEFEARKGSYKTQSLDFVTIGDRVGFTWQALKDHSIDQTGLELRAIGASIALEEDKFVVNALYNATTGQNATDFHNTTTYSAVGNYLPFAEIMRYKARMAAPSTESHPDMDEQTRMTLLNLYNANVLLVPPEVYEDIVTNYLTMDQTFWRNSTILDSGAIKTAFGLTIYKVNTGYFDAQYEWYPTTDVYFVDTRMGGVDMVFKEPLQLVDWPTNEYRRQNMMVYERMNAIVRNRRSIFRLSIETPSGS